MKQWQGENDFVLFKSTTPTSGKQIWKAFYQLHKSKIQVQKEKVAVDKLKTIIKATFKLSNQKGFSLMSLRDLSNETGMSMGSLYAYIGSKGQLAEMIHQFLPHVFDLSIGEQLKEDKEPIERIKTLTRGHLFITEILKPWFFFAYMETKHLNKSTKQLAKNSELKSEKLLKDIILSGIKKGTFVTVDEFLTSMMIKSLLQNWYIKHAKYKQQKTNCEEYNQFIETVIENYLVSQNDR